MEIQIGDTVYLRSGSPRMTVVNVDDAHLTVRWIVFESGEPQQMIAPAVCFELHKAVTKEGANT